MNKLLPLLLLLPFFACNKKTEQTTQTHYPQSYTLVYYKAQDSVLAYATLNGKSNSVSDGAPVYLKMNDKQPDSVNDAYQSYQWRYKGLADAGFTFETHGKTLANTVKATDVKQYSFTGLPDTVSFTAWKTIQWQGPSWKGDQAFDIAIYFADGSQSNFQLHGDSTTFTFPDEFLQKKITTGKTMCRIIWYGALKTLQMPDAPQGGDRSAVSYSDKYIWLIP